MINAGAIATAGLVAGKTPAVRFVRILETFSHYAGRALSLDQTGVTILKARLGHRKRAIGHMLRNFDKLNRRSSGGDRNCTSNSVPSP